MPIPTPPTEAELRNHPVVSREEWLAERTLHLRSEKALTRMRDLVNAEHQRDGTGYYFEGEQPFDLPGLSCFLRRGNTVHHTYSTYGRGGEAVGGSTYFLDLTALGRQEEWEKRMKDDL